MNGELKKSLTDLIDETLLELEELKKSRFSAAEIEIKGPGSESLAGKPVNGSLDAKKGEDEEDDEDKDEAEKAEGTNDAVKSEEADVEKAEDKKDEEKDEDEPHKDDPKHEEKEKEIGKKLLDMHKSEVEGQLKKSVSDMESLMKSYVDDKIAPLEAKMTSILDAVTRLANAPVPAKGVSYKGVAPLMKSEDGVESLSKSEVANKLFELKKSGSRVDSVDIARAEMGHDLAKIVAKYGIQ